MPGVWRPRSSSRFHRMVRALRPATARARRPPVECGGVCQRCRRPRPARQGSVTVPAAGRAGSRHRAEAAHTGQGRGARPAAATGGAAGGARPSHHRSRARHQGLTAVLLAAYCTLVSVVLLYAWWAGRGK
jgi:hypothetical protein